MRIDPAPSHPLRLPAHHGAGHLHPLDHSRHPHLKLRELCPPCDIGGGGPIPFSKYLEKHNREDRLDLSRAALSAAAPAPAGARPRITAPSAPAAPAAPSAALPPPKLGDVSPVTPSAARLQAAYMALPPIPRGVLIMFFA